MRLTSFVLPFLFTLGMLPALPAQAEISRSDAIAAYLQAWAEKSPAKRQQLLEKAVTEQVQFHDAFSTTRSRKEMDAMIVSTQAQFPGLRGEMVGRLREAGNAALFEWKLYGAEGQTLFFGVDAVSFADDGRLQRIEGFIDTRLQ
ncbi:nuclear transport factor 2 family protein [Chitinilyticum litopenaei]|uniref:nuclear transport factor 2 family protein n=1 Tax=Chitinilyticum litopenaei TaxID=1121276 RepID=UPI00041678BE|nr:nuclear transport factor 2 family protein [Chitinilyticum litopenaei]